MDWRQDGALEKTEGGGGDAMADVEFIDNNS